MERGARLGLEVVSGLDLTAMGSHGGLLTLEWGQAEGDVPGPLATLQRG